MGSKNTIRDEGRTALKLLTLFGLFTLITRFISSAQTILASVLTPAPHPKKKTSKKLCERGKKCSKPSPYTHPPPLPFNRQCPYKNNTFQRGFPVKDHHQLKQFHLFSADFFTLGIYILLRKLVTQNSHLPCPAKTDPYDS